jgi:hypothetical protein
MLPEAPWNESRLRFHARLEALLPRFRAYAESVVSAGAIESLLQSAVAIAAEQHLIASARTPERCGAMPAEVEGVLAAWLEQVPGEADHVARALGELHAKLSAQADSAQMAGDSAFAAALVSAVTELEWAHGWLWVRHAVEADGKIEYGSVKAA